SITSAFKKLKEYGFYQGTEHRTIKYLNNLIEQDHRPVKRRNKFYRSLRTASTTIIDTVRDFILYLKLCNRTGSFMFD
uniref:DDE-type integrase/transposase/recombinase n=1 Tax=Enterococcus lactis TaxID=357441 RepID=UPI003A520B43